jgi:hypothetical protein
MGRADLIAHGLINLNNKKNRPEGKEKNSSRGEMALEGGIGFLRV